MASEHWFRWHHGSVTDPKWRVVAKRASHAMSRHVTPAAVVAVWAAMLENASQASPRGQLEGWDSEDVAEALGLQVEEVEAICTAMQGKVLDDNQLSGWEKRQPKREREDPKAAERKAKQRERDMAPEQKSRQVTPCHTTSRHVTPRGEESREEQVGDTSSSSRSPQARARPPDDDDGKRTQVGLFANAADPEAPVPGEDQVPDWVPCREWREFWHHRAVLRRPISIPAMRQVLKRLEQLRDRGCDIGESLRQTMAAGLALPVEPRDPDSPRPNGRGPPNKPPIADHYTAKTYTGTPTHELPAHLRPPTDADPAGQP